MPTSLETDRLRLRPATVDDASVYHRLWTERDDRVPAHRRIDEHGRPTADDIAENIRNQRSAPGLLTIERRTEGDVIGYCGLVFNGTGSADEPELAFELLRSVHNRGYATEAARAVMTEAERDGHERVWAGVWDWNTASRRVLEKLGFRDSGLAQPQTAHGRTILTVWQR